MVDIGASRVHSANKLAVKNDLIKTFTARLLIKDQSVAGNALTTPHKPPAHKLAMAKRARLKPPPRLAGSFW
jgi:hypothetical protein